MEDIPKKKSMQSDKEAKATPPKKKSTSIRLKEGTHETFHGLWTATTSKRKITQDKFMEQLLSEHLEGHKNEILFHENTSFKELQQNLFNMLNGMFDRVVYENSKLSSKNSIQEEELNSLKQEIGSYKQQLEEYEVIRAAGEKINREKKKADDGLALLNKAVEDKENQISALQAKVAELESEFSSVTNELEALKAEIGNKDAQISELEAEEQKIHDEPEALKDVLSDREIDTANLTPQKSDEFKVRYDLLRDGEEPGVSFDDYIDFYVNAIKHKLNLCSNLFSDNYEIFDYIGGCINNLGEYKNVVKNLHEQQIEPIFKYLNGSKKDEPTGQ